MEWGERRTVYRKSRSYICSYNTSGRSSYIGPQVTEDESIVFSFTGRVNGKSTAGDFYHVFREDVVRGVDGRARPMPGGVVTLVQERLVIHPQAGTGEIDARLTLWTQDEVLIESTYTGVVRTPNPGNVLRFLKRDADECAFRAYTTPVYDTAPSRYKWLTERQFIAFGELTLKQVDDALLVVSTYDVYAAVTESMPALDKRNAQKASNGISNGLE